METFEGQKKDLREKRPGKKAVFILLLFAAVIISFLILYLKRVEYYRTRFQPDVYINGIAVEGLSPQEAKARVTENIDDYSLRIISRYLPNESISGEDIGLEIEYSTDTESILAKENPYSWPLSKNRERNYSIASRISFDEEKLRERLSDLECLDSFNIVEPKDAYISLSEDGSFYYITDEVKGNEPDEKKLFEAASKAVGELCPELDLEALGVYVEPSLKGSDPELNERVNDLNRYMGAVIKLKLGADKVEVCDRDEISGMIVSDEEDKLPHLSDELVKAYSESIADRYDTLGKGLRFKTVYGSTVEVRGEFGRKTDIEKESERLKADIVSGKTTEREPVYVKSPGVGDGEIGDNYIEVNLTAQKLFLVKEGEIQMDSDIVSGCEKTGCSTPSGLFSVKKKETNVKVEDRDYAVNYNMEFSEGASFYDASWRSAFGGNIYKTSGTKGGIGLPYSKAKELYDHAYEGMPVICYRTADEAINPEEEIDNEGLRAASPSEALQF